MDTTLQLEPSASTSERNAKRVNPEWVRLLDLLQMNVRYERCPIAARNDLQARLTEELRDFEMVQEVRGLGLLMGFEFQAPSQLRLRIPYPAFGAIHPAMFVRIVVMRLFSRVGIPEANLRKQLHGAEGGPTAGGHSRATRPVRASGSQCCGTRAFVRNFLV